jgi:hypothetical protein
MRGREKRKMRGREKRKMKKRHRTEMKNLKNLSKIFYSSVSSAKD